MDDGARVKIEGMLRAARHRPGPFFTRFLDPAERAEVANMAARAGVEAQFNGGYDPCERTMAALGGGEAQSWPIQALEIRWDERFYAVEHRDLLGALMALGVQRDSFGDIILGEGKAWLLVIESVSGFVAENLKKAGSATVEAERVCCLNLRLPQRTPGEITGTVKTLRLDAVMAAGYGISRQRAAQAAKAGLIKLNHAQQLNPDARLARGDVISFRGRGRIVLSEVGGLSKKGRTFITIQII